MNPERGIIAWMAQNSVAANLLLILVVLLGLYAAVNIKKEVFPTFPSEVMTVIVPYPGSAPEEVEEGIIVKVEEAIQDLDGIKEIRSEAMEGAGVVTIEIEPGLDIADMLNKVTVRINGISSFPSQAEEPVIAERLSRVRVIRLAIYGELAEAQLKNFADEVRDELLLMPGISQIDISGARDFEISIELSDSTLRQYGLTFDQVVNTIRNRSQDLPGGSLRTATGNISLRSEGQAYTGSEFAELVVINREDGTLLKLGEIASIRDGFEDQPLLSNFNGKPAIGLTVYSIGQQNALAISQKVKDYVLAKQQQLPGEVFLAAWSDSSRILKSRINLLLKNALQGGVLVMLALSLFLRPALAFWVVLGVPFSFLGALFLVSTPAIDVSINVISLFGFILVLGIVVDDAIVTGESAYAVLEEENNGVHSVIKGVKRVATATIFGVITTILAFSPMLLLDSGIGRFFGVMAPVVILCLVFSLIETKLILPAHLRHININGGAKRSNRFSRLPVIGPTLGKGTDALLTRLGAVIEHVQTRFSEGMKAFVVNRYNPLLFTAVQYRYLTLAVFIAIFIVTIAMLPASWVRFVFFPNVPSDAIQATLVLPEGTPYGTTHAYAKKISAAVLTVNQQYKNETGYENDLIEYISTVSDKDTQADFRAALIPSTERNISSVKIADRWRKAIGELPGVKELSFDANAGPGGSAIDIQLQSDNLAELRHSAQAVANALRRFDGVFDVRDTFGAGGPEANIVVTPVGEALGLGQVELARQVRQAFFGAEIQRVQRGRHEVRVYARFPEQERKSLDNLASMWVRLPDGREVPFSVVGRVQEQTGISTINRVDRKRIVNVRADINKAAVEPGKVLDSIEANVFNTLKTQYPGVNFVLEGEARDQAENTQALLLGSLIVLVMIYAALAIPLRSYTQPFYIMSVIPFGFVGAILGHFITGKALSILSIIGIIALSGIVVNDSLVLVDYINQRIRDGAEKLDAVFRAGERRFRAVILTSITTFVGLAPLLLETSIQAQFLIPMATSVAFGVMFATTVTLILVPVLFFISNDIKNLFAETSVEKSPEASAKALLDSRNN